MNKKNVFIPLAIICIVVGIWFYKNNETQILEEEIASQEVNILDENFALNANNIDLETLKTYKLPIIIDFGADSCIPCKEMAPVLQKLNKEMQGKVIIKFADVWKNNEIAKDFPVQLIPTQVFYTADGKAYVPSKDMNISFKMYAIEASDKTQEHAFTIHQGGLSEEEMRTIIVDMITVSNKD